MVSSARWMRSGTRTIFFTFEFVKSRLLQEEQRTDIRVQTYIVKSEAATLVAHDPSESCSTCKHRTKCDHCGMLGHVVAKCRKKNLPLRPAFFDRRKKRSALIVGSDQRLGIHRADQGGVQQTLRDERPGGGQCCLGLEIHRNRANRTLHLSQKSYTNTVLERFGMHECKPVATPMETSNAKALFPSDQDPVDEVSYRQAIGSLMYLMVGTRPDLAFVVGRLSQFCEKPLKSHWTAVKRVLRYICGTRDRGIQYGASQSLDPVGYSDSDWGGCLETGKSTRGYLFMLAGGAVSWRPRKQTVVATSSCEAESIASCLATKEALWISRLYSDVHGLNDPNPVTIRIHNSGSTSTVQNTSINQRNKHVDIQYHFVIMNSDAGGSMKVEKLNETNFHAWKQKFQLLLVWKELDEHIDDDPPARETSEFPTWRRRDKRAMACIGLS
eukprot:IDg1019t1